jgi:hypothetical protein
MDDALLSQMYIIAEPLRERCCVRCRCRRAGCGRELARAGAANPAAPIAPELTVLVRITCAARLRADDPWQHIKARQSLSRALFVQAAWVVLSRLGQPVGNAMGSNLGLKRRRSDSTTMCSPLRSPTSSPASHGRFSTRDAPSRALAPLRWRPVQRDAGAVLGAAKARPSSMEASGNASATASLDGPLRAARLHAQAGTKERPPGTNKGRAHETRRGHR